MRIVLTATVLALLVIGGSKPKKEPSTDTNKPTQPPQQTVTVVNQQASERQDEDQSTKPKSYLCRLFSPENLPNIALAIIGALTLGAIWYQAREMTRATEEMKKGTQTAINSERAWLTAEVKNFDDPPPDSHMIWIEIPITNNGRTPARITRIAVTSKIIPFPDTGWGRPGELPKVPEYNDASRVVTLEGQDIIITPTDTLRHMHVYILPAELERIRTRKDSLYVYGSIEYRDTVKDLPHQTCFCAIYWVPERGFNEYAGFMFSQIIPASYFCAT
ncbi:MAG: hypothetical protein WB952_08540 [Terriglobales bacterium]